MIRAFRADDTAAVLALIRELLPLRVESRESLARMAAEGGVSVALADGGAVGFGHVKGRSIWVGVCERARGRGIGSALWARLEDRAEEPARTWALDEGSIAFAAARGFAPVGRTVLSVLEVTAKDVGGEVPEGVELVRWSDLRTIPSELEATEHAAVPDVRPEGSFAAVVKGRPVAYTLLRTDDRGLAENHWTFTLPEHRGQGLATLCKRATIAWARQARIHSIVAANHDENLPMLAINAKLGYRVQHVTTTLVRA